MKCTEFALAVREDFPIFKQKVHGKSLVYLDSAATSQKPQSVIDAIKAYYEKECGTVHRGVYSLSTHATQSYHAAREQTAQFIKAKSSQEIIFTKGTTDGINLIASNFRGKTVAISEMEHHSNIVPWQIHGAKIRVIPIDDKAQIDLDALEVILKEGVDLVSIAHIANSTGTVHPIETVIEMAHAHGAKVLIDAAQSSAHLPLDVSALSCDFLAFSCHKTFGPTGLGILYGKKELLEQLSPNQGGGDMIESVTLHGSTFAAPPLKFEAGTPPIAQVIGWSAALEYIDHLGLDRISAHEEELSLYAMERLCGIDGLSLIGQPRSSIISFVIEGVHHLDLATYLDLQGIAIRSGHHCAQPLMARLGLSGTCRISFAPFNTFDEIDFLIEAIHAALPILR